MAGAKFEYDEHGGTFFYFLLSFEALVVIPCTYYFYPRSGNRQLEKRDKSICLCDNCCIKNSRIRSKEPWRKAKQRFIKFLLLIGWVALLLTAYKVSHLNHDYVAYDPFSILQIEPDASMAEIKKAYRRLSLVYHPDKETGDDTKFMMIAKAYSALTDDESRKNWELYGNPDGPGATSFGIALPAWIVDQKNSLWVLGLYALVFMVALPVIVGWWWYRSIKLSGDQVLYDTTQTYYYFIYKTPYMIFKRVIMVIAASLEFEKSHNSEIIERPSDNIEIPKLIKELGNVGEKNREKPLCFGYSLKARALLHAHLSRVKLSKELEEDKLVILKKCPCLIQDFVSCIAQLTMVALAGKISRIPSLDTMENAMKLSSCIVQALWEKNSSLLQLPHITEDLLKHFTTRRRNIRSIWHLAAMQDDDRRAMLRTLNDDQYDDVMNVISKLPMIEVHVKSEVLDDEDSCTITAGAIVTVTATLIRKDMKELFLEKESHYVEEDDSGDEKPLVDVKKSKVWEKQRRKKSKNSASNRGRRKKTTASQKEVPVLSATVPANKKGANGILPNGLLASQKKPEQSHDNNNDRDSDSSFSNSGSDENDAKGKDLEDDAEWEKFQQKVTRKERILESKSKTSHLVHCPFFPDNKQEHWWVYMADKRKHSLITNPSFVTSLVDKEEIELKFAAPPKPGIYNYSVVVRSDSYVDFDVIKTIQLDVKEAKEVDIKPAQWDVSEEEEEKDEESAVSDSDLATDDEIDDE